MRTGQKGEASVVLDDAIIVLGKAELGQRVIERAARSDEQRRDVQAAAALRRVLLRHRIPPRSAYARMTPAYQDWRARTRRRENPAARRLHAPRSAGTTIAVAVEAGVAVDADIDQEAKPEHHREHRRAPIRNQRQR